MNTLKGSDLYSANAPLDTTALYGVTHLGRFGCEAVYGSALCQSAYPL